MKNFKILSKKELKDLKGGRDVKKYDTNGDGQWDLKVVYGSDGLIKKSKIR